MQYDFGFKNERILVEVNGDYWHGNPKFYNSDGSDNKKILNEIQKSKIDKDLKKQRFAINNNFKLFCIWEDDILNGNLEILNEVINEIQLYKAKN